MTALYFVLAFLVTWGLQLPALLAEEHLIAGPPDRYMALVGLGGLGPAIAAMIVARVEGTGIKALLRPLRAWRVAPWWYLAALLLPGGIFVVASAAWNALGHAERLFYLPDSAAYIAAAVVFPLGEEIGWRGFALPRLLRTHGPLTASAIVGVLWALWHVPMFTLQGVPLTLYAVFIPFFVAGSVLFTWIYRHTRGSLLLAFLTHVGVHLDNPGHAMPSRYAPIEIHTVAFAILAVVLVVADRAAWRRSLS